MKGKQCECLAKCIIGANPSKEDLKRELKEHGVKFRANAQKGILRGLLLKHYEEVHGYELS